MKYTRNQMLNQLILFEYLYIREAENAINHPGHTPDSYLRSVKAGYEALPENDLANTHERLLDGYYGDDADVKKLLASDEKDYQDPHIKTYLVTD